MPDPRHVRFCQCVVLYGYNYSQQLRPNHAMPIHVVYHPHHGDFMHGCSAVAGIALYRGRGNHLHVHCPCTRRMDKRNELHCVKHQ